MKKSFKIVAIISLIITVLIIILYTIYNHSIQETFTNESQIHYYWIVSDKRKPMMLKQINDRGKISENNIAFIPGIFSDTDKTEFSDLPKSWLSYPVVRLLAAHMNAIRIFQKKIESASDKHNHVFVCMEDDIALHKEFEKKVRECADFIKSYNKPARILLGYLQPPQNKTFVKRLGNKSSIYKLNTIIGDPWGTQCYMMNVAYIDVVVKKYENDYKNQLPNQSHASDHFLFNVPEAEHFILETPACIEDHPTFGSMLGHVWQTDYYNQMIKKYKRKLYYVFNDILPK